MFVEVAVEDVVRIPASCIAEDIVPATRIFLDQKYSNRVVPGQGLCICVHHLDEAADPFIYPGDGACFVRVKLSLLVFRPFTYEVIVGNVRHSDASGMLVSVMFCEDIFIPKANLQHPCEYDEEEKLWVWKYLDNELYIDAKEEIRLRVVGIEYPKADEAPDLNSQAASLLSDIRPVMRILGAINEDGLGLVSWWKQEAGDDDDDDDEEQVGEEQEQPEHGDDENEHMEDAT